jgi:hypothetical protein
MTAGQQVPGQSGHDTALPYRDDIVAGSAIDVDRWDWWSHTNAGIAHYYTKGPCPACHADTQDHLADVEPPIEGLGPPTPSPDSALRGDSIEMPVRCRCGTDHGQAGAGGCGRRWSIIGPRIPR